MTEIVIPEEEKGYQCEIVLDSVSPDGVRLTTMRWKYPLMVHAEACRHRAFSRSVASNRAIPTARIIAMVEQDPVLPVYWGRNQQGMQAAEELAPELQPQAIDDWHAARISALVSAKNLLALGVHKQIANRVLMPFQWVTEVVTATDWENFFGLRCHPAAQPEMRKIAEMARDAYTSSVPARVGFWDWHLPFVSPHFRQDPEIDKKVSVARCARTSYRTHEGKISTPAEDLALYDRLVGSDPKHASPTEHQATPIPRETYFGNLRGWRSHRYDLKNHTARDPLYLPQS